MRIATAAIITAIVAALAIPAEGAPARKKQQKYSTTKSKVPPARPARQAEEFGYTASPEHYPVGSSAWWRAMEREGRGGFGDTM